MSSATASAPTITAAVALDAIDEGVLIQDADTHILYANRAASELLGIPRSQLRTLTSYSSVWEIVSETGAPLPVEERPTVQAIRTRRPQRAVTLGVRHADGRLVWLRVSVRPVGDCVVTSLSDISDLRRVEDEAASLARRLGEGHPPAGGRGMLSRREREVVELLALGLTGDQVGERLGIASATVRVHIRNATGKLGASTRTQAVAIAVARGEVASP
jgi:PAS domain S-box-containing protein